MNAQQLKASILQYAMQGKLVPQDPNDEPANKLFEHICKEKERLIQQKVIKAEKPLPPITKEEIPFEIPETWEWVYLQDCGYFFNGYTPKSHQLQERGKIPYFKVSDMNTLGNNKYLINSNLYIREDLASLRTFPVDSIVYPKNGGAIYTNKRRILAQDSIVDLNTGGFGVLKPLSVEYFYMYFTTLDFKNYSKGTALPTIDMTKLRRVLIPLPPLNEQKRITEKIYNIFEKATNYNFLQKELEEFQKAFPGKIENSILQYAMQGKLVEQNPNDEPATELVKRVREEKTRLLEEKIIKKEKALLPILDEEIPFDIPMNWTWVRLGEVINLVSGQDFPPDKYNHNGIGTPYITGASTLTKEDVILNRWTETPQSIAETGDLLVVCKGSGYGKTLICNIEIAHIARQIMAIKKSDFINMEFINFYLQSQLSLIKKLGQGVIPGIDRKSILNLLLPLPPLNEQSRIVDKIKNTRDLLNKL